MSEPEGSRNRAHPMLRLFAGVAALPFVVAGIWSAVADFPLGTLTGVWLTVLGLAAGFYAWRGREPRGFNG